MQSGDRNWCFAIYPTSNTVCIPWKSYVKLYITLFAAWKRISTFVPSIIKKMNLARLTCFLDCSLIGWWTPSDINSNKRESDIIGRNWHGIMSTQKAVTTTAVNKLGERVAFRNCTLPESKVAEIYDAMNYQHQPFKRRKICTPQTYPPEYSSCCTAISSAWCVESWVKRFICQKVG